MLGFDLGERKARVFDGGLYVGSGGEGGWEGSGEGKSRIGESRNLVLSECII